MRPVAGVGLIEDVSVRSMSECPSPADTFTSRERDVQAIYELVISHRCVSEGVVLSYLAEWGRVVTSIGLGSGCFPFRVLLGVVAAGMPIPSVIVCGARRD